MRGRPYPKPYPKNEKSVARKNFAYGVQTPFEHTKSACADWALSRRRRTSGFRTAKIKIGFAAQLNENGRTLVEAV
jgi:hypothetical protein